MSDSSFPPAPEHVELRNRHRDYYLALARSAAAAVAAGEDPRSWDETFAAEAENLRAALAWCASRDDPALAPLAVAAAWWWHAQQLYREGGTWLKQALALEGLSEHERAEVLVELCAVQQAQGEFAVARETGLEAVAASHGDSSLEARARCRLAWVQHARGELREAEANFARAVELGRESMPVARFLDALRGLGWVKHGLGDDDTAVACHDEARSMARSSGSPSLSAAHLLVHANLLTYIGRPAEVLALLDEQAGVLRVLEEVGGLAYNRVRAGETLLGLDRLDDARQAFEEVRTLVTDDGPWSGAPVSRGSTLVQALLGLVQLEIHRGELSRPELLVAEALAVLRIEREPGWWERRLEAFALSLLATVALQLGDLARAEALLRQQLDLCNGIAGLEVGVHADLADLAVDRNDLEGAERHLVEALRLLEGSSEAVHRSRAELTARLEGLRADILVAAGVIEAAVERANAGHSATSRGLLWCHAARYRLAQGDHPGAARAIAEAIEALAASSGHDRTAKLVEAEVAAASGDTERVVTALRGAFGEQVLPRTRVRALEILAECAARNGEVDRALALVATADAERRRLSHQRRCLERAAADRIRQLVGDPPSGADVDPAALLASELARPPGSAAGRFDR